MYKISSIEKVTEKKQISSQMNEKKAIKENTLELS